MGNSIQYNLLGEIAAFFIAWIVLISLLRNYDDKNVRTRLLKALYICIIVSIFFTVASTLSIQFPHKITIPLIYLTNIVYFMVVPACSLYYTLYILSFTESFIVSNNKQKIVALVLIPYILYILFNIINIFTHWIFTIDSTGLYIRGPLFQAGYFFAFVYILAAAYLSLRKLHPMYASGKLLMFFNLVMVSSVTFIQFFVEHIITSGIASVSGVLVIHLYIQNIAKNTDYLTGLKNRLHCQHKIETNIHKKKSFSVFVFSIKNFKVINTKLGLDSGNLVIKEIAKFIVSYFDGITVYRYNNDQFSIVVDSVETQAVDYDLKVQHFLKKFEAPFQVEEFPVFLNMHCARVDYPLFGNTCEELQSSIDYSLDTLEAEFKHNTFITDSTILAKACKHNFVQETLINALVKERIVVHYQPIYNAHNSTFNDAEALVRILDENNNVIFPVEFIDLAEKTGLVVELTYKVLEKVCFDLQKLLQKYPREATHLCVSVNFAYANFLRNDMPSRVSQILEKYNIPSNMIKIEITERTVISEFETVNSTIKNLHKAGFVLELDDFGIEYSNLNALFDIRCDEVKIDKHLLRSAISSASNTMFFENLIKGIHTMGKK